MAPIRSGRAQQQLDQEPTAFSPSSSSPETVTTHHCQDGSTSRNCRSRAIKQSDLNQPLNGSKVSPRKISRAGRKRLSQDATVADLTEDLMSTLVIHDSSNMAVEDMDYATAAFLQCNLTEPSRNTNIPDQDAQMNTIRQDTLAVEELLLHHSQSEDDLVSQIPVAPVVSESEIVDHYGALPTYEPEVDSESESIHEHASSKSTTILARVESLNAQLQNRVSPYGYRACITFSVDDIPRVENAPALTPLILDLWPDMVQAFFEGWSVGGVPTAPELTFESLVESAEITLPKVETVRPSPPPLPRRSKATKRKMQACTPESDADYVLVSSLPSRKEFSTFTTAEVRILERRDQRSMRGFS